MILYYISKNSEEIFKDEIEYFLQAFKEINNTFCTFKKRSHKYFIFATIFQ